MGRQKWFSVFTTENSGCSFLTQTRLTNVLYPTPEWSRITCQKWMLVSRHNFDKKITFPPHMTNLKKKGFWSLNIYEVLSRKHWGSYMINLLSFCCILFLALRWKVHGSARPSYLKRLEPVHNLSLVCAFHLVHTGYRPQTVLTLKLVNHLLQTEPCSYARTF